MPKALEYHSIISYITRVKILDSSQTDGRGLTGLTHESAGLIISTIANNEASATAYTQAGGTIETISTLGTYATPTATKCRFKEVDSTNHPGLYEIQLANARFAVANARSIICTVSGATNCAETDFEIQLSGVDVARISNSSTAADNLEASAKIIVTGTVSHDNTAATPTVFYCDDITEATADHFIGRIVIFTSGALLCQATDITDYELVSGEGKFTVTALTEAPADNVTFVII